MFFRTLSSLLPNRFKNQFLISLRILEMLIDEFKLVFWRQKWYQSKKIFFNMDLHISVISDLEDGLKNNSVKLIRWSISEHNHLLPKRRPISDPVKIINSRSWKEIDEDAISKFQNRYRHFLKNFDGFICTHSPSFSELYKNLNKKILVMASTRYEMPYSNQMAQWNRLNFFLKENVNNGLIQLYANNLADSDYLKYFTNLEVPVVPSLCEKTSEKWVGGESMRLILSRDRDLSSQISTQTEGYFKDVSTIGSPYEWADLLKIEEIFVLPQNVSTMSLFEFATAGIPVAVPSKSWIKELRSQGYTVLSELTFHEMFNLKTSNEELSPINYKSPHYLNWWLDRADFYNEFLMPNVRVVNNCSELVNGLPKNVVLGESYWSKIDNRNEYLRTLRSEMINKFINS